MKGLLKTLFITLPLAGCFDSGEGNSKPKNLDDVVESNYTINEGITYSNKLPIMKGQLILAHTDIEGVSIETLSDGWVLSFKAPWVKSIGGEAVLSKSYTLTLQQKVNEYEERKKTVTFNVMDIKSVPELEFDAYGVEPKSVVAKIKKTKKGVKSNSLLIKTRNEHGFMLPFKVLEKDADNISLGFSVAQKGSALSGARIEQVSSDLFKLVVPIDIRNPLKDTDISVVVSDMDGEKTYTVTHRRIITPKINMKLDSAILVSKGRVASVAFDKNFSGDDYHFEVAYYDNDMKPTSSNVWVEHKLNSKTDNVKFSVTAVPEKWDGIVEIIVVRDGERGVHHYPISVR